MSWSDERLVETFQAGLQPGVPGPDCPPAESIWDAANGGLSTAERERVALHSATCPPCAFAWQAARELRPEDQSAGSPQPRRRARWTAWLRPTVLAPLAGAAAAVLVALVWLGPDTLEPLAGPQPGGVLRGVPTAPDRAPDADGTLRPGDLLSWPAVTGASAYRLTLYDQAGHRVTLLPEGARVVLPAELAQSFADGERVYWIAEAIDGERSGVRSATGSFQFHVDNAGD